MGNLCSSEHLSPPQPMTALKGIHELNIVRCLGKGGFSQVLLVRQRKSGQLSALKVVKKNKLKEPRTRNQLRVEQAILSQLASPFFVSLQQHFECANESCMLLEFVPGGTLYELIRRHKRLEEDQARFFAAEVACALQYLHQHGIIYRDLKPENVLVELSGHIKMTDFNLSCYITDDQRTHVGTIEYMAPEVVARSRQSIAIDYWGLGVLLYEMVHGYTPFCCNNKEILYYRITNNQPSFHSSCSPAFVDLVQRLLCKQPEERLSSAEVLQKHLFFADIDWTQVRARQVQPPLRPEQLTVSGTHSECLSTSQSL